MKKCLRKKCQQEFEPNKPKQVFCSAKCRVYYSREEKKEPGSVAIKDVPQPQIKPINKMNKDIPPMPLRSNFDNSIDFAAAKNEWKIKYNQ